MLKPNDFNYLLPEQLIAQTPSQPRDTARLLVLDREKGIIKHAIFKDIATLLGNNDVLVLNDSKVFPARLIGKKTTGGRTEVLLLRPTETNTWEAMSRGLKPSQIVYFDRQLTGHVLAKNSETGYITIKFESSGNLDEIMDQIGTTPIPPYIHTPLSESVLRHEYQNVYADHKGSAAAPTAGMHFTQELLNRLATRGVQIERVTLHVGPGTFAKLRPEQIESKTLHHEWYSIDHDTADRLNQAKQNGKRIIAVGTTSCRTLESAILRGESLQYEVSPRSTNLFIMPPYKFKFVDAMITNFHLPESSLLMLVTAFVSTPNTRTPFDPFDSSSVGTAYKQAIKNNYRFFSFGDAMFIY